MIRLAVRCRPELAERVLAELVELVPGGVEEEHGDGYVELAVYGPPGELPALPDLEAAAGDGLVEIASTEIPDDWADRWRDFHQPVVIGEGRIVVRPSWHEPRPAPPGHGTTAGGPRGGRRPGARAGTEEAGGIDVVVDPGQAFGTGAHATTSLCLELLLELADAGEAHGSLVDLGTGSAVLAVAAAKLGWAPVLAVDHQPAALEAARANSAANGVGLELRRANLRQEPAPAAETIVANLTAPLLLEVAGRLQGPPRNLICSGLLASEVDSIATAFAARGLTPVRSRSSGDWAAVLLRDDPAAEATGSGSPSAR